MKGKDKFVSLVCFELGSGEYVVFGIIGGVGDQPLKE